MANPILPQMAVEPPVVGDQGLFVLPHHGIVDVPFESLTALGVDKPQVSQGAGILLETVPDDDDEEVDEQVD